MARVLVIGDTHCPGMHSKYPSFLQRMYKRHKCNRVVHIGDAVDNAAISYHEKNPTPAPDDLIKLQDIITPADMTAGDRQISCCDRATGGIIGSCCKGCNPPPSKQTIATTITKINAKPGQSMAVDEIIMEFE